MAKKTDNNAAFLEKFKECEQLIRQTYGDDKNFKWFEDKMKDDGEEHGKWAEIEDINDMREYLVWEAQGMRPNYRIEDYPE